MPAPTATPASVTDATRGLLAGYAPLAGCYDEMVLPDGSLRPHWSRLAAKLDALGPQEMARLGEQAQRLIYENGITFSTTEESSRHTRPWRLDAVPVLLAAEDWAALSAGLEQRATLLNAILNDIYGPQELVRRRLLPPEIVFANPQFLRPVHQLRVFENRYLQHYAADLARAPDGRWWVLGDRTSAPAGAGYALENRLVTSRIMPDVFRECQVERLAPFFMTVRESLERSATRFRENPRVVLLTRGPGSPEYFEDAYLARYLGYTLVEGGDLAVRENRVMLKTLGGLLPIEVILRHPRDEECDPVELRGDSVFGVSGLLEVLRAGNVSVANVPGSGIVESPMLLPFLPALCRHFLRSELLLPSIATWWCGDADALCYVLEHLDALIIRAACDTDRSNVIHPGLLSVQERANLVEAIRRNPAGFVGQETVRRSTAPVWEAGGPVAWHLALRAFLVARQDGYTTMPGGLIRLSEKSAGLEQSMAAGDRSQDLWVLADGPVANVSLLRPAGEKVPLRRSGAELPSRVADNLYWLGRYVERAEGSVRLLRAVFARLTSETAFGELPELPMLLRCLAVQGQLEPGFVLHGISDQLPSIDEALPGAMLNELEDRSLRSTVNEMRRVANLVRDRISLDVWRIVTRIDRSIEAAAGSQSTGEIFAMLNQLVGHLSAFGGLVGESMTRTLGWRFLEIGRRIERSLYTSILLRNAIVEQEALETSMMEATLEVADSLMTYRSRYLANFQAAPLIDLLLLDETNPRSVGYQLAALLDHVENLPRDPTDPRLAPAERLAMTLLHSVRMSDAEQLVPARTGDGTVKLDRLLARIADQLPKLGDAISHKYLIHAGEPRQFGASTSERTP